MTSQEVAQALMRGLNRDSPEVIVGWQGKLAIWGNRLMPWLLERTLQAAAPQFEDGQPMGYGNSVGAAR
jgi:3-oxoacyl-[acyl-carrier protein] reductase